MYCNFPGQDVHGRALYDKEQRRKQSIKMEVKGVWDIVQLKDLTKYDETTWRYTCRCGDVFEVFTEDVEEHVEVIPCNGCSLEIQIVYQQ